MNQDKIVKYSKYLSRHLRHRPDRLGLTLETGGWVRVSDLLAAMQANDMPLSLDTLRDVVKNNDKQRFSFSSDGKKIRADQGHSIEVDLELEPVVPPTILYHGTDTRAAKLIEASGGIDKMGRQYVHLSSDTNIATRVGMRHGKPVVLSINAESMHNEGYEFFLSDNGVWLTEYVPWEFIFVALHDKIQVIV